MRWKLVRIGLGASLVLASVAVPTVASAERFGHHRGLEVLATARARVRIVDNAFRPKTITVARGTRVRWVNRGTAVHSVKPAKGRWGSDLLQPGDRYGHVFRRAGTFAYYCTVHPTMKGKIVVT